MSKDETIVSRGRRETEAIFMTIIQTHNILLDKFREDPKWTIDAELYIKDVGFLLRYVKAVHDSMVTK